MSQQAQKLVYIWHHGITQMFAKYFARWGYYNVLRRRLLDGFFFERSSKAKKSSQFRRCWACADWVSVSCFFSFWEETNFTYSHLFSNTRHLTAFLFAQSTAQFFFKRSACPQCFWHVLLFCPFDVSLGDKTHLWHHLRHHPWSRQRPPFLSLSWELGDGVIVCLSSTLFLCLWSVRYFSERAMAGFRHCLLSFLGLDRHGPSYCGYHFFVG